MTGTGTTGSGQNDGDQGTAVATTRPTGKAAGDHHDRPRTTRDRDGATPQPLPPPRRLAARETAVYLFYFYLCADICHRPMRAGDSE